MRRRLAAVPGRGLTGAACPLAAFMILLSFLPAPAADDPLCGRHGAYSKTYLSDWSTLPNGKDYPRRKLADYPFEEKIGEEVKQKFVGQASAELRGRYWKVKWKAGPNWESGSGKYETTLFLFRNCEKVVIEDVAVMQLDPDYRASHAILVEGCGDVIIRNVTVAGATAKYHIRVEGCERVFIDNVEVCGYDYGPHGIRFGSGINVHNGETGRDGAVRVYSPNPRELKWCVIQNCDVHDCHASDKWPISTTPTRACGWTGTSSARNATANPTPARLSM
ncbi:MAG: right-handed parallel beta-helix repeat-containing protein [Kiritimatiellae bacterium]|nr:right-handed parallel beta-helix repeat-containing protein [Kiritimatiellia bacterium]